MTENFKDNKFSEEEIKEKLREIAEEALKHYDKAMKSMDESEEFNNMSLPFDYE